MVDGDESQEVGFFEEINFRVVASHEYTSLHQMSKVSGYTDELRYIFAQHTRSKDPTKGYVYLISTRQEPLVVKIGKSTDPQTRCSQLQTGNAHVLHVAASYACDTSDSMEVDLHRVLHKYNINLEWFALPHDICSFIKRQMETPTEVFPEEPEQGPVSRKTIQGDITLTAPTTLSEQYPFTVTLNMVNERDSALVLKHDALPESHRSSNTQTVFTLADGRLLASRNFEKDWCNTNGIEAVRSNLGITDSTQLYVVGSSGMIPRSAQEEDRKQSTIVYETWFKKCLTLLTLTMLWSNETCHASVRTFRSIFSRRYSRLDEIRDLHLCRCGMVLEMRTCKKRTSVLRGHLFYGCRAYPKGCNVFEWVNVESQKIQDLTQRMDSHRGCSKKEIVELATLQGYTTTEASKAFVGGLWHTQRNKRKRARSACRI